MRITMGMLIVLASTSGAAAQPELSVDEAANRAAIQDQVGNRCPLVEPNYPMRLVLASFKNRDPQKWANAYTAATKELSGMFETDSEAICLHAVDLYGSKGSSVPKLVKGIGG